MKFLQHNRSGELEINYKKMVWEAAGETPAPAAKTDAPNPRADLQDALANPKDKNSLPASVEKFEKLEVKNITPQDQDKQKDALVARIDALIKKIDAFNAGRDNHLYQDHKAKLETLNRRIQTAERDFDVKLAAVKGKESGAKKPVAQDIADKAPVIVKLSDTPRIENKIEKVGALTPLANALHVEANSYLKSALPAIIGDSKYIVEVSNTGLTVNIFDTTAEKGSLPKHSITMKIDDGRYVFKLHEPGSKATASDRRIKDPALAIKGVAELVKKEMGKEVDQKVFDEILKVSGEDTGVEVVKSSSTFEKGETPAEKLMNAANAKFKEKKYAEAAKLYGDTAKEAQKENGERYPIALIQLGKCYTQLDQSKKAYSAFADAVKAATDRSLPELEKKAKGGQAIAAFNLAKYDEAKTLLPDDAEKVDPDNAQAYKQIREYLQKMDTLDAIKHYESPDGRKRIVAILNESAKMMEEVKNNTAIPRGLKSDRKAQMNAEIDKLLPLLKNSGYEKSVSLDDLVKKLNIFPDADSFVHEKVSNDSERAKNISDFLLKGASARANEGISTVADVSAPKLDSTSVKGVAEQEEAAAAERASREAKAQAERVAAAAKENAAQSPDKKIFDALNVSDDGKISRANDSLLKSENVEKKAVIEKLNALATDEKQKINPAILLNKTPARDLTPTQRGDINTQQELFVRAIIRLQIQQKMPNPDGILKKEQLSALMTGEVAKPVAPSPEPVQKTVPPPVEKAGETLDAKLDRVALEMSTKTWEGKGGASKDFNMRLIAARADSSNAVLRDIAVALGYKAEVFGGTPSGFEQKNVDDSAKFVFGFHDLDSAKKTVKSVSDFMSKKVAVEPAPAKAPPARVAPAPENMKPKPATNPPTEAEKAKVPEKVDTAAVALLDRTLSTIKNGKLKGVTREGFQKWINSSALRSVPGIKSDAPDLTLDKPADALQIVDRIKAAQKAFGMKLPNNLQGIFGPKTYKKAIEYRGAFKEILASKPEAIPAQEKKDAALDESKKAREQQIQTENPKRIEIAGKLKELAAGYEKAAATFKGKNAENFTISGDVYTEISHLLDNSAGNIKTLAGMVEKNDATLAEIAATKKLGVIGIPETLQDLDKPDYVKNDVLDTIKSALNDPLYRKADVSDADHKIATDKQLKLITKVLFPETVVAAPPESSPEIVAAALVAKTMENISKGSALDGRVTAKGLEFYFGINPESKTPGDAVKFVEKVKAKQKELKQSESGIFDKALYDALVKADKNVITPLNGGVKVVDAAPAPAPEAAPKTFGDKSFQQYIDSLESKDSAEHEAISVMKGMLKGSKERGGEAILMMPALFTSLKIPKDVRISIQYKGVNGVDSVVTFEKNRGKIEGHALKQFPMNAENIAKLIQVASGKGELPPLDPAQNTISDLNEREYKGNLVEREVISRLKGAYELSKNSPNGLYDLSISPYIFGKNIFASKNKLLLDGKNETLSIFDPTLDAKTGKPVGEIEKITGADNIAKKLIEIAKANAGESVKATPATTPAVTPDIKPAEPGAEKKEVAAFDAELYAQLAVGAKALFETAKKGSGDQLFDAKNKDGWQKTLKAWQRVAEMAKGRDDEKYNHALTYIGAVESYLGNAKEAVEKNQEARAYYEKNGNKRVIDQIDFNISKITLAKKKAIQSISKEANS